VIGLALAGCGGDDDGGDESEDAGPQHHAGSGGSNAGTGGTNAGTGGGGSGGTGMTAEPIECGSGTCTDPLGGMMIPGGLPITLPMVCCADPDTATCGSMMPGGECMPPAPSDPRCPTVTSPLPGITLTSCCTDTGLCGLDASMLGMGCVDFATVMASPFGGFLPVPGETSCEGDGGVDTDAGN
jgi:hypothetical protein